MLRSLPSELRATAVLVERAMLRTWDASSGARRPLADVPRLPWLRFQRSRARLLEMAAAHTSPGGCLVYATCTIRVRENQNVVRRFLAAHADFFPGACTPSRGANHRRGRAVDVAAPRRDRPVSTRQSFDGALETEKRRTGSLAQPRFVAKATSHGEHRRLEGKSPYAGGSRGVEGPSAGSARRESA